MTSTQYEKQLNRCAAALMNDEYYQTVATGFIIEAIEQAAQEAGPFESIDALNDYIKANLI